MSLPSLLTGCKDFTGSEYDKNYENSYVLEAWFATAFSISFPVEISGISTNLVSNTTHFGYPV